jgi:hypothetical protein
MESKGEILLRVDIMSSVKEQEVNMSTVAPAASEPRFFDWRTDVGFAVAVTFIISVSVIERWHAYRLFDKCFSVLVLLTVLTLPWEGIRMKKRTKKLDVWYVCLLLMMVTLLFR